MNYSNTHPHIRTTLQDRLEREAARLRQLAGADVRLSIGLAPALSGIRVSIRGYTIVLLCEADYPATAPHVLVAETGKSLTPLAINWSRYTNLRELVMDLVIDLMLDDPDVTTGLHS